MEGKTMKRLVLALLAFIPATAQAQTACAPLPDLLAALKRKFNEVPIWEGQNDSFKFIIVANGDDSWTVISVAASGEPACLITSGKKNKTDHGT